MAGYDANQLEEQQRQSCQLKARRDELLKEIDALEKAALEIEEVKKEIEILTAFMDSVEEGRQKGRKAQEAGEIIKQLAILEAFLANVKDCHQEGWNAQEVNDIVELMDSLKALSASVQEGPQERRKDDEVERRDDAWTRLRKFSFFIRKRHLLSFLRVTT